MDHFDNPDYDGPQTMQLMAKQSDLFNAVLSGLVFDTDSDYPTNQAWLGTINKNGKATQVKLVVTQEPEQLIDED